MNVRDWHIITVVFVLNCTQYRQSPALRRELFATAHSVLVEASKDDFCWGIGSTKDDPLSWRCQTWRGTNMLGNILTETRDALMKQVSSFTDLWRWHTVQKTGADFWTVCHANRVWKSGAKNRRRLEHCSIPSIISREMQHVIGHWFTFSYCHQEVLSTTIYGTIYVAYFEFKFAIERTTSVCLGYYNCFTLLPVG